MNRIALVILVAALTLSHTPLRAECRHLFRQTYHAKAVVYPHVVQQNIFYSVGEGLIRQNAIEKEVERQLALRQQQQAQQQQPQVGSVFAAKCAKCHTGDSALTAPDGSLPAETFRSFVRMAGTGEGIPTAMKAVIAGLTPEEKGRLTEELLSLPTVRPVAPPVPEGELR
jgi:cytochrome c553